MKEKNELDTQFLAELEKIPDEVLSKIQFSMPWQDGGSSNATDEDGFPVVAGSKTDTPNTRLALQEECWRKFNQDPFLNTSVRGQVGRKAGWGFETTSENWEIQEKIDEIELDPRNRLYTFWPKFIGRYDIEGELFLLLTPHLDGFVEVDFIDPGTIVEGGDDGSGIIFHPNKSTMPLFYNVKISGNSRIQAPSIFIARYPELVSSVYSHIDYSRGDQQTCRNRKGGYKAFGGYSKFIVACDKGFITKRAVSYLRTTLQWLNHYENLKKYEIDHKKSSGSYLWTFSFKELKDFRLWLSLTDEQKKKTGILAKKTPGSSLVLPPGMDAQVINPNLPTLSGEDHDIKELVAAGVNEASDIMTGTSKGTYASVKETRGPMSDRTADDVAYHKRFLVHDFWSSVFFLAGKISDFPETFAVEIATHFENKKVKKKKVKRTPERLIDISFPVSETLDLEAKARALLGVKHGPMAEQLGIPNSRLSEILGLAGYGRYRLEKALEDEKYPELEYNVDAEAIQESKIEPSKEVRQKSKEKEKK